MEEFICFLMGLIVALTVIIAVKKTLKKEKKKVKNKKYIIHITKNIY